MSTTRVPSPSTPAPALESRRSPLRSPALAVAVSAACLTLLVGHATWRRAREHEQEEARSRAVEFAEAVQRRLDVLRRTLHVSRGIFYASRSVERHEWRAFVTDRNSWEGFRGARGFAFVQRVRPDEVEAFLEATRADDAPSFEVWNDGPVDPALDLCVIKFHEPESANRAALGLNVASMPVPHRALWRSVELDEETLTPVFRLAQGTPGAVMYLPVYAKGASIRTAEQRRRAVEGWVALPLDVGALVREARHEASPDDLARLVAPDEDGESVVLYADAAIGTARGRELFEEPIESAGQRWTVGLFAEHDRSLAALGPVFLSGGIAFLIGGLLTAVVWSISRTRDRALEMAGSMTERLASSEERYALAVRGSRDGIWDWDLLTDRVFYAARWKELLGLGEDEVGDTPQEWFGRIHPASLPSFRAELERHIAGQTDRFDREVEMLHAGGETRWMLCRAAAIRDADGMAVRLAGSLADIDDLKRIQVERERMALRDQLTGLPNRALFTERVEAAFARRRREPGRHFAILFFDFDRFKVVNDSLGHDVGDALLRSIADRFRTSLRETDTVARFGGDEFVVLLERIRDVGEAQGICDRLLELFARPHILNGHHVVSTASIGVVTSELEHLSAQDMLRDADVAMYQAKVAGKARYVIFDSRMHREALERLTLEEELRHALEREELRLHYQPIVSLRTGEIAGFEALVRWEHREKGMIPPGLFVPIAEETGQIVELGAWATREACRQLVAWRAEHGGRPLFVNVNLSRRQLVHPDLLPMLRRALEDTGASPSDVKLEITETTVMDERHDIVSVMHEIEALGFRLAMDDFGTGHSSLSSLHRFPIDVLKVDGSFIRNMEKQPKFSMVMQAIVTLAHHLQHEVVAEGIESESELSQLLTMDCEYGQGYLFAPALAPERASELLREGLRVRRVA